MKRPQITSSCSTAAGAGEVCAVIRRRVNTATLAPPNAALLLLSEYPRPSRAVDVLSAKR
jgi:hypothetical protein